MHGDRSADVQRCVVNQQTPLTRSLSGLLATAQTFGWITQPSGERRIGTDGVPATDVLTSIPSAEPRDTSGDGGNGLRHRMTCRYYLLDDRASEGAAFRLTAKEIRGGADTRTPSQDGPRRARRATETARKATLRDKGANRQQSVSFCLGSGGGVRWSGQKPPGERKCPNSTVPL